MAAGRAHNAAALRAAVMRGTFNYIKIITNKARPCKLAETAKHSAFAGGTGGKCAKRRAGSIKSGAKNAPQAFC